MTANYLPGQSPGAVGATKRNLAARATRDTAVEPWKQRLRYLQRRVAYPAHGAMGPVQKVITDLHDRRRSLRPLVERAEESAYPSQRKELEQIERDLAEFREELAALEGHWQQTAHLQAACEEWLESAPNDALNARLPQLKGKAPVDIHAVVDDLRGKIADLQAEAERIRRLPPSKAEALEMVRARVTALAKRGAELAGAVRVGRFAETHMHWPTDGSLALLAWANGDALVAAAAREIDADTEEGISHADRAKALADIAAQEEEAEIREEQLVRLSELRAQPILRRADASPRIVLMPEAE